MKKTSKRLLALLLSVLVAALAAAGLMAAAADETPTYAGTCNDNITWTLKDGVLTLNGTGKVEHIQMSDSEYPSKRWDSEQLKMVDYTTSNDESYYPWDRVIAEEASAMLSAKLGLDLQGDDFFDRIAQMYANHEISEREAAELELDLIHFSREKIHTIIVGEGITDFEVPLMYAWADADVDTLDLPSTFVGTGNTYYDFSLVQNLIIRNPDLDLTSNSFVVQAYYGDTLPWNSREEICARMEEAMRGYGTGNVWDDVKFALRDIAIFLQETMCYSCDYQNLHKATEENFLEYLDYEYELHASSIEEFVQISLAEFNDLYGTNFASLYDVFDIVPCDCNPYICGGGENCKCRMPVESEAFKAAETAIWADYYDGIRSIIRMQFDLGKEPVVDLDLYDAPFYNLDAEGEVPVTPVPWFTVYGYAGSTAETAAATSGVHFEALCPTDHANTTAVNATASTCIAHGYTSGVYCEDCGKWLSGHEELPFGEHDKLGARETIKEPTETEEGQIIITCSVCGERGLYAIEKLPHTDALANDGDSSSSGGVFGAIRRAVQGIINWLLRLIKWLGK